MPEEPIFPGGTSVSHLRVYDWPAPDAPGGSGSPHFHTTSTEAYVVLGGRGRVETLGPDGFASHELTPGRIVWFSPGVIHRAVNGGGLEVLVVMSNAGLPESGDAVLTFPPAILASADAYRDAVALPPGSPSLGDAPRSAPAAEDAPSSGASRADSPPLGIPSPGQAPPDRLDPEGDMVEDEVVARAARARRDLALEGYARLREAVESDGPEALEPLYRAASHLVAGRAATWRDLWTATVARAASDTDRALALLADPADPDTAAISAQAGGAVDALDGRAVPTAADGADTASALDSPDALGTLDVPMGTGVRATPMDAVGHLMRGAVTASDPRTGPRRYGMCGRLRTWPTAAP